MDRAEKRELVSTLNEAWKDTGVIVVAHYAGTVSYTHLTLPTNREV